MFTSDQFESEPCLNWSEIHLEANAKRNGDFELDYPNVHPNNEIT